MIGTHARQNTYQRLGIAESWWLLLDVLDDAAWMKIERAVDALGSLDLLHLNNGSSCRASGLAAEDPRRVGELRAVLRQVGAAGVVRNHHLNARAAEVFIGQFRSAASPIARLENEKIYIKARWCAFIVGPREFRRPKVKLDGRLSAHSMGPPFMPVPIGGTCFYQHRLRMLCRAWLVL